MCENKNILKEFSLILRMGKIESGPPLSTILGNIGINTVKLVKELLENTQLLPDYFLLEVKIIVYFDKTYIFLIREPSIALFLRLVAFKKELTIKTSGGLKFFVVDAVKIEDLYLISFLKFGNKLEQSLRLVYGVVSSLNLYVTE